MKAVVKLSQAVPRCMEQMSAKIAIYVRLCRSGGFRCRVFLCSRKLFLLQLGPVGALPREGNLGGAVAERIGQLSGARPSEVLCDLDGERVLVVQEHCVPISPARPLLPGHLLRTPPLANQGMGSLQVRT